MKGNRSVNTGLNQVLGLELIEINQSFLHARILKNWGFEALADEVYEASIEAMKQADKLIERILFLEGLPNLQDLGKITIGQKVPEVLSAELTLETSLRAKIVEVIALCEKETDFVSRDLLASILEDAEEWIDFLETQIDLVTQLGLENYLQSAVKELES
jgi:bacterioferritin